MNFFSLWTTAQDLEVTKVNQDHFWQDQFHSSGKRTASLKINQKKLFKEMSTLVELNTSIIFGIIQTDLLPSTKKILIFGILYDLQRASKIRRVLHNFWLTNFWLLFAADVSGVSLKMSYKK